MVCVVDVEEHPTAAVPHVAETASIVATRAPWGREEEEEDSRRQRSMSAGMGRSEAILVSHFCSLVDLLLLPHIGSSHEGGALRPPPSPGENWVNRSGTVMFFPSSFSPSIAGPSISCQDSRP